MSRTIMVSLYYMGLEKLYFIRIIIQSGKTTTQK